MALDDEVNLRRAARVDANQPELVKAMRKLGAVVIHVGHPFDVLIGFRGRWIPIEIKDPTQPPSKRRLTEDEQAFFNEARAGNLPVATAETLEDLLLIFGSWPR